MLSLATTTKRVPQYKALAMSLNIMSQSASILVGIKVIDKPLSHDIARAICELNTERRL